MSLGGKIRIMVNLERIINSGMLHKGYYYLRVEVNPRKKDGKKTSKRRKNGSDCKLKKYEVEPPVEEYPYQINSFIIQSSTKGRTGKFDANHVHNNSASDFSVRFIDSTAVVRNDDIPSEEVKQEHSNDLYNNNKNSKVFYIRYREQEVLLNEIIVFDISSNMTNLLTCNLIDIDYQLFHLKKRKDEEENILKREFTVKKMDVNTFSKVADRRITIRKGIRGCNLFYPVVFENWFYSIVRSTIHSSLIDITHTPVGCVVKRIESQSSFSSQPLSPRVQSEIERKAEKTFEETWFTRRTRYQHDLSATLAALFPKSPKIEADMFETISHSVTLFREIMNNLLLSRMALLEFISPIPPETNRRRNGIFMPRRKSVSDMEEGKKGSQFLSNSNSCNEVYAPETPTMKKKLKIPEVEQFLVTLSEKMQRLTHPDEIPELFVREVKPFIEALEEMWYKQRMYISENPKKTSDFLEKYLMQRMVTRWTGENKFSAGSSVIGSVSPTLYSTTGDPSRNSFQLSIDNLIDNNLFFPPQFSEYSLSSEVFYPSEPLISVSDIMGDDLIEPILEPKEGAEIKLNIDSDEEEPFKTLPMCNHLIVFIPGYRSSHYDFVSFRTILSVHFHQADNHELFIIKSLDKLQSNKMGYNNTSIKTMAKMVTDEVLQFINDNEVFFHKVSFVCHSLGGIILRSAFYFFRQSWKRVHPYLHTLMTLSVPHLGIGLIKTLSKKGDGASSHLVRAGIWFLKSLKGEKCLQELSMEDCETTDKRVDSHKLEQSLIFKLSMTGDLSLFRNVILIGSAQDTYVPMESALIWGENIQPNMTKTKKKTTKNVLERMILNLQETLSYVTVVRCKCDFSDLFNSGEKKESTTMFNKKAFTSTVYDDISTLTTLDSFNLEQENDNSDDEKEEAFDELKKKPANQPIIDRITKKINHTAYLNHIGLINGICCAFRSYLE